MKVVLFTMVLLVKVIKHTLSRLLMNARGSKQYTAQLNTLASKCNSLIH